MNGKERFPSRFTLIITTHQTIPDRMTDSQVRSSVLAAGVVALLAGAFFYLNSQAQEGRISQVGVPCKGGAVIVKYLLKGAGPDSPITRESFDDLDPIFIESGNLCVLAKILSRAAKSPASSEDLDGIRTLIFFASNNKEIFITHDGGVVSLATEEKFAVKREIVEIMAMEIERTPQVRKMYKDMGIDQENGRGADIHTKADDAEGVQPPAPSEKSGEPPGGG
jgi:hypothetical protein